MWVLMAITHAIKRKVVYTLASMVVTAAASYLTAKLKQKLERDKNQRLDERKLETALVHSMDCSDPVAKY